MRRIVALVSILFASATAFAAPAEKQDAKPEKFVIYYADKAPAKQFKPYELAVLDSTHHPDVQPLKEEGKVLLGYISLGEINKNSPYFNALKTHNLILNENPNWKDSFTVDIRDTFWAKTVLEEIVPSVLRQGFDGIFIDTLDSPIALEEKNRGMSEAAVHLIEAIRMHYPSIKIMLNRGYEILPKVANSIDMELGESVYASYNFEKKAYRKVSTEDYQAQLKILQDAKTKNSSLKIYTLDYADAAGEDVIKEIYKTERANGFVPYVATIGLDRILDEPGIK